MNENENKLGRVEVFKFKERSYFKVLGFPYTLT